MEEQSKDKDVEDGWVETDNPMHGSGGTSGGKAQAMDIDDIQNIDDIDKEEQQEALDIDAMDTDS